MAGARHLVVGRLRKPHGLKGEITLFPLTDDPGSVFAPGRSVWIVDLEGQEVGGPFEVERSREVYLHELEGFAVRREDGRALGLVSAVYELPGGLMLEVQGPKREFLLPYRKQFIVDVDRDARKLTVAPPDGLIEE